MDTLCPYYLGLLHSECVPVPLFSRLLKEFGTSEALRALPPSTLEAIGMDAEQVSAVLDGAQSKDNESSVAAALEWSHGGQNHLLCYESENYPPLLREIDTAPPLLFVRGSPGLLKESMLSIVGSRRASMYGKRNARWIAGELAAMGMRICSGLASGIDTMAHEGTLSVGGQTIAVIGTGIDRIYPQRNKALADRIAGSGAIVSEFPLGVPPYPGNFPRRNRIISGLALGTLVVEGNIKSGSLITARLAMEQNREVFAMPGPIGTSGSRGCHQLIKQGARLVEEPADILEEFGIDAREDVANESAKSKPTSAEAGNRARVLAAVQRQGSLFESVLAQSKLDIQVLNTELIELEAAGLIQQEGGRYFRLR